MHTTLSTTLTALAALARAMDQVEVEERDRIRDHLRGQLEDVAGRVYEQGPSEEMELRTFTGGVASLCLLALDSAHEHVVCSFSIPASELLNEAARRWAALPLEVATVRG
jgi:hypothetical protein